MSRKSTFSIVVLVSALNRPYAFSYLSWGTPYQNPSLVSETYLKVGIPLGSENLYFSTFQIPLESRCQRGSNGI